MTLTTVAVVSAGGFGVLGWCVAHLLYRIQRLEESRRREVLDGILTKLEQGPRPWTEDDW